MERNFSENLSFSFIDRNFKQILINKETLIKSHVTIKIVTKIVTIKVTSVTMTKQIKSKQRVADHWEVFTREQEVNAMLDLVKDETLRIESRFLEPACGDGNFLIQILKRKLEIVEKNYRTSQREYEFYAVLAICSIYGIEFLKDNVEACRKRLLSYFIGEQIDAESYPLFICLVLAMILVVIDGVYKQHAKGSL